MEEILSCMYSIAAAEASKVTAQPTRDWVRAGPSERYTKFEEN